MLKSPVAIGGGMVALVVLLSETAGHFYPEADGGIVRTLLGATLLFLAVGVTVGIKKRREKAARSRADDSLERALADRAQSRVMRDALIAGILLASAALFVDDLSASIPVLVLVVFMLADFWIRYSNLLRRATETA